MIKSKSIYQLNIVFLLKENAALPENKDFMSLFEGETGAGMNFVDDPITRTKLLLVPKAGLNIAWEGRRLRVEDLALRDPESSGLPAEAVGIYEKLFAGKNPQITGFGFNFGLYYQTTDVIRLQDFYLGLNPRGMELGEGLMDFGWQWTVAAKDGKQLDGYFVKITAPLELSVHHNAHFNRKDLPGAKELGAMFARCYGQTHEIVRNLAL